ncbi:MAG: AI-2E family transporter [Syntrophobacteraceae bacterium]
MNDRSRPSPNAVSVVLLVSALGLSFLLLWYVLDVLLLVFAGLLVAIFLRGTSNLVARKTGFSDKPSLALVVVGLGGIAVLGAWLLAPDMIDQLNRMFQELPNSVQEVRDKLSQSPIGKAILSLVPDPRKLLDHFGGIVRQATGFLSTMMGAFISFIIAIFIGLYFSINPSYYVDGVISLIPQNRRKRFREVFAAVASTLHWWLLARLLSMSFIGLVTGVGLWLLGIPMALALGILAAILSFIPNIGPVLSAVPAVLLSLTSGYYTAVYVVILYLFIQSIESYVMMPIIQQRTISLPPVLTLTAQLVAGILMGMPGIIIATPLAAAVMVLVRMLYIEDVLGNRTQE